MSHISVVIPIFREEDVLHELYRQLRDALSSLTADFEIMFVADGGSQEMWQIVCELSEEDPRVKGMRFSRNFGQHFAITAGLDAVDGDWVVVMDGDLQDRPAVIPALYAKAQEGYDVVFVERKSRPEGRLYKAVQRLFYALFIFLAQGNYNPEHGNYSIISRRVVDSFRSLNEHLRFYGGLVTWFGYPAASIEAQHGERFSGSSGYDLKRRIRLAGHMIVAHSDKPLRLSIGIGLLLTAVSFFFGTVILIQALLGAVAVQGWASLIVSVYFIGGIILMVLGVVGIYVGKIYNELKRRPLYVVEDAVGLLPSQSTPSLLAHQRKREEPIKSFR